MLKSRNLTQKEIEALEARGCTAENWQWVRVAPDFDARRVRQTSFFGEVEIGSNSGFVTIDGLKRPCGIHHATLASCRVGRNVYIADIGSSIQHYDIEDEVVLEDVSSLVSEKDATFGNGYRIQVLNETGGREVTLFNELNAQIAYIQTFYRHDAEFQKKLEQLIGEYVSQQRSERGRISCSAQIRGCGQIRNTNIGPHAVIRGALRIEDGTILSCAEHPTVVGAGVFMNHFILSEGASVDSGAVLNGAFVGQGTQVGKQCSVENSLLFANSEAFHTEICSVFGGPFTVTHHKSTLLIASLWSFYNAGSGTNQSNHMYKLGPVHQGIFERGCKTGSFAYNMMACHVPAFTVIIGKHMANLDIADFPFSYLYDEEGRSNVIMGVNIFSIGTVRDAEKWPARDRRKALLKRDLIVFDVFSPYTVEKMRRGRVILQELYEKTPREEKVVLYGGAWIKRLLMKKGIRYYTLAIDRYLLEAFVVRVEKSASNAETWDDIMGECRPHSPGVRRQRWSDLGGLLISEERVQYVMESVRGGGVRNVAELLGVFEESYRSYSDDAWDYVCHAFEQEYGIPPSEVGAGRFGEFAQRWAAVSGSLLTLIMENTKSEFSSLSQIGYGLDGGVEERTADFTAVRGTYEENPVVQQLVKEKERVEKRLKNLEEIGKKFS